MDGTAALAALLTGCALFGDSDSGGGEEAGLEKFEAQFEAREEKYREAVNASLPVYADPVLDGLRSVRLKKFSGEAAFLDWMRETAAAASARDVYWQRDRGLMKAAMPMESAAEPMPAPPPVMAPAPAQSVAKDDAGADDEASQQIVVTGSPADSANPEITNNQKAGVDEGGIVKQIGTHLVVLQDGRLFVADLMPGGKARPEADRPRECLSLQRGRHLV